MAAAALRKTAKSAPSGSPSPGWSTNPGQSSVDSSSLTTPTRAPQIQMLDSEHGPQHQRGSSLSVPVPAQTPQGPVPACWERPAYINAEPTHWWCGSVPAHWEQPHSINACSIDGVQFPVPACWERFMCPSTNPCLQEKVTSQTPSLTLN